MDIKKNWLTVNRSGQVPIYIPITLQPTPGVAYALNCIVKFDSQESIVGKEIPFQIIGYDQYGFKTQKGGDVFRVQALDSEVFFFYLYFYIFIFYFYFYIRII